MQRRTSGNAGRSRSPVNVVVLGSIFFVIAIVVYSQNRRILLFSGFRELPPDEALPLVGDDVQEKDSIVEDFKEDDSVTEGNSVTNEKETPESEEKPNDPEKNYEPDPKEPQDDPPSEKPPARLIMVPYRSQTNALTYRTMEFLALTRQSGGVKGRRLVEPMLWIAPFNDTAYETALRSGGENQVKKYTLDPAARYELIIGEEWHPFGRYYDLERISKWVDVPMETFSEVEEWGAKHGGFVDVDRLLIMCGNKTWLTLMWNETFPLSEKVSLRFKSKECYDKEFLRRNCSFPNVSEANSTSIAVVHVYGHPIYGRCVTGHPKKLAIFADKKHFNDVRQHFRWSKDLYAVAGAFRDKYLQGPYLAIHWRRGDKLVEDTFKSITPQRLAKLVRKIVKKHLTPDMRKRRTLPYERIFLATNSGSPTDITTLQELTKMPIVRYPASSDWRKSVDDSIVEQIICSEADFFLGAPLNWKTTSGFTRMIMDVRTIDGKEAESAYQAPLYKSPTPLPLPLPLPTPSLTGAPSSLPLPLPLPPNLAPSALSTLVPKPKPTSLT